jgi:hypothetical protein
MTSETARCWDPVPRPKSIARWWRGRWRRPKATYETQQSSRFGNIEFQV